MLARTGPRTTRRALASRVALPVFYAAVALVHLSLTSSSIGPMYVFDEVGYLAGAQLVSGAGTPWALCGSSYSAGYSVVLAPLWWLDVQPITLYQIAVVVTAAAGALVMWPATLLARELGASRWRAALIAALVTLVPTRALLDNYVLAENILTLLVVCSILLAVRLERATTPRTLLMFGVCLGALGAMHSRALPFVAAGLAWLIVRWWLKRDRAAHTLNAVLLALVIAGSAYLGQVALGARLFPWDERLDGALGAFGLQDVGTVVAGQAFIQIVSWSILPAVGAVAAVSALMGSHAEGGRRAWASPWAFIVVAGGLQALFIVLVLSHAVADDSRFDIAVYGRYLDPFLVGLAIFGAVAVARSERNGATRRVAYVALAAVAIYCATVLPFISEAATWIPISTPGLLPYVSPWPGDARPQLLIAAGASVAIAALILAGRRRALAVLWCGVLLTGAAAVATDILRVAPFEEAVRVRSTTSAFLWADSTVPATIAATELSCADRNKLQFELAGRASVIVAGDPGSGYVVGPADWPEAEAAGYTPIPFSAWDEAIVWAAPELFGATG